MYRYIYFQDLFKEEIYKEKRETRKKRAKLNLNKSTTMIIFIQNDHHHLYSGYKCVIIYKYNLYLYIYK